MGFNLEPVTNFGIHLYAEEDTIFIKGNIDTSAPGQIMAPFLLQAHKQALEQNMSAVKINITELSYLNSSAISELSDWLLMLEDLPEEKVYKIDIFCNLDDYEWQYSTMKTLQLLLPDLVKLH